MISGTEAINPANSEEIPLSSSTLGTPVTDYREVNLGELNLGELNRTRRTP